MAQRLPRAFFALLAAIFLLLVAERSNSQQPELPLLPPAPPGFGPPPKPAEPPPAPKELSKEEIDGLIEKAFGKDCAELKRPIRIWVPDVAMVITAEKATMARDGLSVRFASYGVGFIFDAKAFRGDDAVVTVDRPVTKPAELSARAVVRIELEGKDSSTTLRAIPQAVFANAPLNNQISMPPGIPGSIPAPRSIQIRFKFKIDPTAPQTELLPTPVKASAKLPLWTNEDLAKVPELGFGESLAKELPKLKAMERTAHAMAKVNHLNEKKTDGFMLALMEARTDLRGLPFLMGDDCRTREEQAIAFRELADIVNQAVVQCKTGPNPNRVSPAPVFSPAGTASAEQLWSTMATLNSAIQRGSLAPRNTGFPTISTQNKDLANRAMVAALMQILMPEAEQFRLGLAQFLATVPHPDATKALAKLAIISPEDAVRVAAIEGLKLRREKDYTDVLIQGFRYPLPAVAKRSAEALVKLERKDLLANLVEVLESPDPRLPVSEKRDGKDVTFVRELVKVNHHKNCLLCHAPGNTENTPEGVLKVAVPLPGEPLAKPSEGGYGSTPPPSPDIVVRLDMTYLRQDFSVMMPVSEAHPWPEMQRFDFLVRTRVLTSAQTQTYVEADEPGRLSPYHRAALFALRELTGRDTEPTAAAWRKLLKLAAGAGTN